MPEGIAATVLLSNLSEHGIEDYSDELILAARAALSDRSAVAAELSVTFVTDQSIAELNHEYLQRSGPTDVLAFCLGDDPIVGDVYISAETARRNARACRIPLKEELLRLVVHGTLHVLGYDHPEGDERQQSAMFQLQESLVDRLLSDPPER
jgi:probable rRNA maturation factor